MLLLRQLSCIPAADCSSIALSAAAVIVVCGAVVSPFSLSEPWLSELSELSDKLSDCRTLSDTVGGYCRTNCRTTVEQLSDNCRTVGL